MNADLARIEEKLDKLTEKVDTFMLRTENRVTKVETKTLMAGGVVAATVSAVIGSFIHAVVK